MQPHEFDLGEALAGAMRNGLPFLRDKPLGCAFDSRLPLSRVIGSEVDLQCGLHRLMLAAIDLMTHGFLVFDGEGYVRHGKLNARVMLAGSGQPGSVALHDAVLKRLSLEPEPLTPGMRLRRAHGCCPHSGAQLEFVSIEGEGVLFKFRLTLPLAVGEEARERPDAGHVRAWVIDPDAAAGQMLSRRLQRLGWAIWRFGTLDEAQARLQTMPKAHARPALVVASESAGVDAAGLGELATALPAARCVLALAPASSPRGRLGPGARLEAHMQPFSEADLRRLTTELAHNARGYSGHTQPAPLLLSHRPRLLVVDDDELNRLVGVGLAQTLGFEASAVANGLQAVAACLEAAPDLVVMDVSMPVLDGPDATAQLRQLQREGRTPPFPILGATADATALTRERCLAAGMDGVLTKPLLRDTLKAECQRLLVNCIHA